MNINIRNLSIRLVPVLLLLSNSPFAGPTELDRAVKKYYAGYPVQAINIIKPMAISGDAEAQYLLGNIFYGLSKSESSLAVENPVKWYEMAAEQDSAPASYALGVIYNNRWVKSSDQKEAELAKMYYQKALGLGYKQAEAALHKLTEHNQSNSKSTSLVYTNESFNNTQKSSIKPKDIPNSVVTRDVTTEFKLSDNPVADLMKLQTLLSQLINDKSNNDFGLDESTISTLLSGFDSTDKLVTDVVKLLSELRSANFRN